VCVVCVCVCVCVSQQTYLLTATVCECAWLPETHGAAVATSPPATVDVTCLILMWHDSLMCDSFICADGAPIANSKWNKDPIQENKTDNNFVLMIFLKLVHCMVHMRRDSFSCDVPPRLSAAPVFVCTCVTWLIHMWHNSFMCDVTHWFVTWLIHVWHDSFICDINHSYVVRLFLMWHDSFIRDMSYSYVPYPVYCSSAS